MEESSSSPLPSLSTAPSQPNKATLASQLDPEHSSDSAAKATSHVDQISQSSSASSSSPLPPLSIPLPPISHSSNPSPTSALPKLKTHPADLVSRAHPDPHSSPRGGGGHGLVSPTPSVPCSPIKNSYEDLPSATLAEGGHGFNTSFVDPDPEEEGAGRENGTLLEEEEGEDEEDGEGRRRGSEGFGSENGATVGSHSVHHHNGNGFNEGGDDVERINGLEVVGEEPVSSSMGGSYSTPVQRTKELPSIANDSPLPPPPPQNNYSTPPSSRRFDPAHSRSMSTPPTQSQISTTSTTSNSSQFIPPNASLFSPTSPPAMSPPASHLQSSQAHSQHPQINPLNLPPLPLSNPPSRRPSSSQRLPPTSNNVLDQRTTSGSGRSGRERESTGESTRATGNEKERLSDSITAGQTSSSSRSRRTLGEWQMTKTLGAGSMGKVKLGVSSISGEKVAIKIIPRFTSTAAAHRPPPPTPSNERSGSSRRPSSASNNQQGGVSEVVPPTASFLAKAAAKDQSKEVRTVREGSLSLLLHHPYVCGMREMMIYPHHYYFVQEYVNGGQMLDYIISHGRLRERSARKFARQIGSALEYCHANSIVHRDLKIENILISKTGNIKIIDFGLSNLYSPLSHLSTFCGSLYFAAPELLNAKPYTGPEVDVWSFGIVLYVLVCGKVPFDDQSMPALHAKIKRGQVEYPNWLSAECKHLLSRMLVTVPAQRASLHEVLSHPWIVKGFTGAPAAHIPARTPLRFGELDPEVIKGMTGFEFGTREEIEKNLNEVLGTELYKNSVRSWEIKKSREAATNGTAGGDQVNGGSSGSGGDPEKERPSMRVDGKDIKRSPTNKRFSGLGFYGKKLAGGFNAAFAGTNAPPKTGSDDLDSASGGGVGFSPGFFGSSGAPRPDQLDPTRGFHPLISIYFLVKEKIERERIWGPGVFASSTISLTGPPPPPAPAQVYHAGSGIVSPALVASPELARPPAASPLIPMTPQPRQRATGEEFAPHPSTAPQMPRTSISQARHSTVPSSSAPNSPVVAGFRPQSAYEPPHSPSPRDRNNAGRAPASSATNRMSLSISPSERDRLSESVQSPEDVPLSSSSSAGGFARRFGSLLGRSSPESGKGHRSRASIGGMAGHRASNKTAASPLPQVSESTSTSTGSTLRPPVTRLPSSGSDVPLASPPNGKPVARASTVGEISPSRHQRGVSMGATSLMRPDPASTTTPGDSSSVGRTGTGFFERRRQASLSTQPPGSTAPPPRPNTSNDIAGMFDNVAEEELADSVVAGGGGNQQTNNSNQVPEVGFIGRTPSRSSSGKDTSESAKPVWLKGLFSVSTTTTKPVATLRSDLIKVLDRLGVQHRDVKNGFECVHVPSIDLSSFGGANSNNKEKNVRSTIKRRASKLLLQKKDGEVQSQDETGGGAGMIEDSQSSLRIATDPTSTSNRARTQSSGSFTPVSPIDNSPPLQTGGAQFDGHHSSGEAGAAANPNAVSNDMIVRFEIFIVKMPLLPGFHGIQFRRISGNAYLTLVKRILQELKL